MVRVAYRKEFSILDEPPHIPTIVTFAFTMIGIIGLSVSAARAGTTSWPFLWLWIVFAALVLLLYTVQLLARFSNLLKHAAPYPPIRRDGTTKRQIPLAVSFHLSKPVPSLPNQPGSRPSSRISLTGPRESVREYQSSSITGTTGYPIDIEEISDFAGTRAKRHTALIETQSNRYSFDTEDSAGPARASYPSFNRAKPLSRIHPARLSVNDYLWSSRHSRRPELPFNRPISLPSLNDLHVEQEEDEQRSNRCSPGDEHDEVPPPSAITAGRSDGTSRMPTFTYTSAPERPPSSNEDHPPSSFTFPGRSPSPSTRPPTAVSSLTTAPPYSAGPYLDRRDTITSSQTYETLPSYHSRQSTQTLADMGGPSTPRNIRSLPPLPTLPPFPFLSSIRAAPLGSSATLRVPSPPASLGREGTTFREPEPPEQ
ncbi:hypothetical protein PM082_007142 [Marasmius tenuissimus]|nr:hypothetical protein PM082_007142 [Marasmius tenuissimus]